MTTEKSSQKEVSVKEEADKLEQLMKEEAAAKKKATPKKKAAAPKKKAPKPQVAKPPLTDKGAGIVGKAELLHVDPAKLVIVWEDNPRKDYGDIKTLEASIESRGVENPIRVKRLADGALKLEAGYRRTKACLNLIARGVKVKHVPAILEKAGTTEKETLIHVFIENDGKSFNPMEEAGLFREMKELGMSDKEIGQTIGRTAATISRRLSLLKASPDLQTALRDEVIPLRTALRIIKANRTDLDEQKKLLDDYVKTVSSGDKEDIKKARSKVAKASGNKEKASGISQNKAKSLLDDIASKYTAFARTQKPANNLNPAWVELSAALKKVRTMKRKGEFN